MPRRKAGVLLPLELAILDSGLTLQSADASFYGFALARALADRDGAALIAHGTLYKALGRLADAGLLESEWESPEAAEADGRPRRRLYRVTGAGEQAVRAAADASRAASLAAAAVSAPRSASKPAIA
ncbi:PadR family transcriptional regulator [Agromyces intestinalis]|uniref:PadR family transcriptional regulator n=1 Tax=Agromyces intestinalis TaxID=2592652 RepID=A0A5C1YHZ5_9MICO|nr:helix-turn-helix transcriptional regulator [Agromyces intestinalis]QEO15050.1 PadR family transcriptional regulator [Agromyces intestinalis]